MSRLLRFTRRAGAYHFDINWAYLAAAHARFIGLIWSLRIFQSEQHFCLTLYHIASLFSWSSWDKSNNLWRIERTRYINRMPFKELCNRNDLQFLHSPRRRPHFAFRQNLFFHPSCWFIQTNKNAKFGTFPLYDGFQFMNGVNANVFTTFYGDNGAVWLFNSDAVVANNAIDATIGAGALLGQAAKLKHRPLLKFEPIARSQRSCIIRVFGTTKQLVAIFYFRSERLHKPPLDYVNSQIGDIDSYPSPTQFFGCLNRGSAATKWV